VGFVVKPIEGGTRSGGSTWQSLARGASTLETDYLNGEIALLGRQHGVPTPINEALQRIAAEAARTGMKPGSMTSDELAARVHDASR
jgi:2-dehydropantoate 2-reductase